MIVGPDTKYMMQHRGEWRAVTHMFDHSNTETTLVSRCAKAVLHISEDEWIAIVVFNTADIVERFDRNPDARDWEYVSS